LFFYLFNFGKTNFITMIKTLFSFIISLLVIDAFAQNAKVIDSPSGTVISNAGGTDIPYSASILDIRSSTRGILLPRMSTSNRDAIGSPQAGLLLYNSTTNQFNYHDGAAWQQAFFGNQWAVNGANISYSGGNVGIGTPTPIRPLNIFNSSDANVNFNTTASGTSLTDGLYVGIQSTNKAFIYNFENAAIGIGTNNTERFTILGNGNVGIGNLAPTQKLDVNGTVKLSGELNRAATGTANLVPIAFGTVQDNGFILSGSGNWTIADLGTGHKQITVTGVTLGIGAHTIVGSTFASTPRFASFLIITGELEVFTYNASSTLVNTPFSFVIYSQ
jgi:hypothetical protein